MEARRRRWGAVLCTAAALFLAMAVAACAAAPGAAQWTEVPAPRSANGNTWAVIVSTSRYWLNYRHAANALAVYRAVRRAGVPDSRIVLMLAEDFSRNPRNVFPGSVFVDEALQVDVARGAAEVDYEGDDVSAASLARVLTGRHAARVPRSRTLPTTRESDVLLYVTGHGGENFMKFQDKDMMSGEDLAEVVAEMRSLGRYRELTIVVDTCKASTFCRHVSSPNVTCVSSSLRGQNSYSKHANAEVGNSLVDEMTFLIQEQLAERWFGKLVGRRAARAMCQRLRARMKSSTPHYRET